MRKPQSLVIDLTDNVLSNLIVLMPLNTWVFFNGYDSVPVLLFTSWYLLGAIRSVNVLEFYLPPGVWTFPELLNPRTFMFVTWHAFRWPWLLEDFKKLNGGYPWQVHGGGNRHSDNG
jgi:hypothetical protein